MRISAGLIAAAASSLLTHGALAQSAPAAAAVSPSMGLHRAPPNYPVPYGAAKEAEVRASLERVHGYLASTTPMALVDRASGAPIARIEDANAGSAFRAGDFGIVSYEWGVTYSGMLLASEVTGDPRYAQYTKDRLTFIARVADHYRGLTKTDPATRSPVRPLLAPRALDDAGAMGAAMIRTQRLGGLEADLRPLIDVSLDYISTKEFRLADRTLARNRPLPDTLWLDDLYMSVPALAQMGALTGERRYFDDATRQILQFSSRMFNPKLGLYMHGWVQGMDVHPEFRWGRANGWAALAMVDLLEVLPADHPDRAAVLKQLQAHIAGLANYQSGSGFWHQLIDRPDSYEETSATAIFAFVIARAANRGWVDHKAYGPMALLAWNAVSTKINARGQVEDVCVGTGMAFDPAFYYHRPVNVHAAHGYGPVLLAGAEVIQLVRKHRFVINDSAVMYAPGQ